MTMTRHPATHPPLILASASPRRREILSLLGYPFEVAPSHVEETFDPRTPPDAVVQELALRKALEIAANRSEGIVVGSDTLVILPPARDERDDVAPLAFTGSSRDPVAPVPAGEAREEARPLILGKPVDDEDALRMLLSLSGRWHEVHTGIAVVDAKSGKQHTSLCRTAVKMREMPVDILRRYVATKEPMDKAGAYAIQGEGAVLVEEIRGDYFNVVGLPLSLLGEMLSEFGFELFPERG